MNRGGIDEKRKSGAGEERGAGLRTGEHREDTGGCDERKKPDHSRFWYDFGRYNLTGWSVVLPTLAGIALGYWLDSNYPQSFSWTITLMVVGLVLGCMNAWYWISRTDHKKDREKKKGGPRGPGRPGRPGGPRTGSSGGPATGKGAGRDAKR